MSATIKLRARLLDGLPVVRLALDDVQIHLTLGEARALAAELQRHAADAGGLAALLRDPAHAALLRQPSEGCA